MYAIRSYYEDGDFLYNGTMPDRSDNGVRDGRRVRLLVFDLDGTLVDSKTDLANSVNHVSYNFV